MERKSGCTQQLYHIMYPLVSLFRRKNSCTVLTWIIYCLGNKSGCVCVCVCVFWWLWVGLRQGTWAEPEEQGPKLQPWPCVMCFASVRVTDLFPTSPLPLGCQLHESRVFCMFGSFFIPLVPVTREGERPIYPLFSHTHTYTHIQNCSPFCVLGSFFISLVLITGKGKRPMYPLFTHTHTHTDTQINIKNCSPFCVFGSFFYIPRANNWRRKEIQIHTHTHTHTTVFHKRIWKSSPKGKYKCWWRE